MEQNEIIEGNKLIAGFMGNVTIDSGEWVGSDKKLVPAYEYHTSWDWLMPVVEKIEGLAIIESNRGEVNYVVTIEDKYCVISVGGEEVFCESQSDESKIGAVYSTVLKFLNRYNAPHPSAPKA